jgi:hypothetical protein
MKFRFSFLALLAVLTAFSSCEKDEKENTQEENVIVVKANGDIQDDVDAFRHLLGDQLNNTPGVVGGRREINWEGVPDTWLGLKLPEDFFNPTGPAAPAANQRGLQYAAIGRIQVSKTNFSEVNSNASPEFAAFSGTKAFANVSVNDWEVGFEVPGQEIPASVKGFGAVFSDVDLANSTSLEFFNGNKSLGKYFAPVHTTASSFSFLGIYFKNNERITKIRVIHDGILLDGQKDISNNGPKDLIIMDDLIYSEPVQ